MSLRVIAGFIFVLVFSIRAWRNYFPSLCALIVFTAFFKHPDMPRSVAGIPGLEFWNVLLANVTLAWLVQRRQEGAEWDLPAGVKAAFVLYGAVIVISFLRMFVDPTDYYTGTRLNIVLDYFVAPLKFLVPGIILYDASRSRDRAVWGLTAIMLAYFFLSVQVVRYMGLHVYSGDELNKRGARILQHTIGYDRVDMAMMLAGSVWGMIALAQVMTKKVTWLAVWGAAGFILMAETLTGGRGGYLACGIVGLTMCLIRWRRFLPLIPIAGIAVAVLMPGVRQRMFHGFDKDSGNVVYEEDHSEITSGRTIMWPYVIKDIKKEPLFGYGRSAMVRTGLYTWLLEDLGEEFQHPHNAYLEMLFDNGLIGLLCIVPIYYLSVKKSLSLFVDRSDPVYEAAGGVAFAMLLALLVTGFGAQTLYPREDVIMMWGAVGIALRLWMQREAAKEAAVEVVEDSEFDAGVLESEPAK